MTVRTMAAALAMLNVIIPFSQGVPLNGWSVGAVVVTLLAYIINDINNELR